MLTNGNQSMYSWGNHLSGRKDRLNSTLSSFGKPESRGKSFFMRRSVSSCFKNTQGKLDVLGEKLIDLNAAVQETRRQTKETSLSVSLMKEDLVDRELPDLHSSLQQNIKALNQAVNITKRSNKLRFEGLLRSVQQLKKNSRSISSALFLLKSRMEKIEQVMGFYTGSDKYN